MHSFIPDMQIDSVSFYVCENHTVIETAMRKCVLQTYTCTKIKVQISCVVVANGMDIFCFLCAFKL